MASTPTTRNRLEKQGTGENGNTWGTKLNGSAFDLIDASLDGWSTYTLSGSKTLSSTNYVADEARMRVQNISSGTGGTITIPGVEKLYLVRNASSGDVIITTGGATTATVKSGNVAWVVCDSAAVYLAQITDFGSTIPKSSGTPSTGSHLVNKTYADAILTAAEAYADGLAFSSALPAGVTGGGVIYEGGAWVARALAISDITSLTASLAALQPLDSDLTAIAAIAPTNDDVIQRKAGAWTNRSMAQVKMDLALAKGDVGLGNVDNTSDANKPVSTAGQTALDLKANLAGGNTFTGKQTTAASASGGAGLTLPHGAAPTSPVDGDVWTTSAGGLYVCVNGATIGPLGPAVGMTLIQSSSATSTAVDFNLIPQTYDDLYMVLVGVSHNDASTQTIRISLSGDNGSSYTSGIGISGLGGASATFYGSVSIPGYRQDAGYFFGRAEDLTADTTTGGGTQQPRSWRIAGGIDAIRMAPGASSFDAGTFLLFGR